MTNPRTEHLITACLDGSDEAYQGLRWAADLVRGHAADIILLHVRKQDALHSFGGINPSIVQQSILHSGMEIPGQDILQFGREILIELGNLDDRWTEHTRIDSIGGDPIGDHFIQYTNPDGHRIGLKLKASSDIATGILEQQSQFDYQTIILGAPEIESGDAPGKLSAVVRKVAIKADCGVVVARHIGEGHGHLIAIDDSVGSIERIERAQFIIKNFFEPVTLMAVAQSTDSEGTTKFNLDQVTSRFCEWGVEHINTLYYQGDTVQAFVDHSQDYGLTMIAMEKKNRPLQFFSDSQVIRILEESHNSVMLTP
ncbi:MAG: universal stress protein [Magnetococcales bacterium]|nr:universal stress protein [Magnetococcales bacterium]